MRRLLAVVLLICPPRSHSQSFSRDWRPEDRTVIGDFSRINAIAASAERVYMVSSSGVLIWNPQFQRWEGSYDPPDRTLLTQVFAGMIDPLAIRSGWPEPIAGSTTSPTFRSGTRGSFPREYRPLPSIRTIRVRDCFCGLAQDGNWSPAGERSLNPRRLRAIPPRRRLWRRRSEPIRRSRPTPRLFSPIIACPLLATPPPPAPSTIAAGFWERRDWGFSTWQMDLRCRSE